MPDSNDDPAVHRRRLRTELRALRRGAGYTQRDVADAMYWSPSKIIRIESGEVRVTPTDLMALLGHYGVTDPARVELLVGMAKASRDVTWAEFRDVHTKPWLTYLAYEQSASVVRNYTSLYLPGLLQIEEYAMAVYEADGIAKDVAERRWEARLRRQLLHDRPSPPRMYFVIDQAVVMRHVGGAPVMRRQLEQVKAFGELPHVSVRVIPFSAGAYWQAGRSLVLLEFPDPNDDDLLHVEDPEGGVTMRDEVDATAEASERFVRLEDKALPVSQTRALLDELIATDDAANGGPPAKDAKTK